ncbi:lysophospholipase [Caenimonas sedimenti]|uniref:Lysophospholipase n=1 Tax=Caenimonas sedimenti TaxID=2596921 RepID=A0A562ZUJ0_9BURK|nr:alpha/beta fold hydrolase [Caenimonas sedimenti]TWO72026.1 lysophospholipase [Caenimonas sedimenti]
MVETTLDHPIAGGRLSGTLATPEGLGPWPVVLVIGGSGATDRDGNNPLLPEPCSSFRRLAGALSARGLASLRYDKRGVGRSVIAGLSESALRFDDLVDDAVALARLLRADERFSDLVLFGHSEGALVAALAANATPPELLVCASGAGERASDLMRRQIVQTLPADLASPAVRALDALERQTPATDVPDTLAVLFRPTVQPYLMSWFRHSPAEVLANLAVPIMLLHGAADTQVPADQARLLQAAHPEAELCVIAGMDHLLAVDGDYDAGARRIAGDITAQLARAAAHA